MPEFEFIKFPFGDVKRRVAEVKSPTLLATPQDALPPAVACATCPSGSWYYTDEQLACHCKARHYVSWKQKSKGVLVCDDREAALAEIDAANTDHGLT